MTPPPTPNPGPKAVKQPLLSCFAKATKTWKASKDVRQGRWHLLLRWSLRYTADACCFKHAKNAPDKTLA